LEPSREVERRHGSAEAHAGVVLGTDDADDLKAARPVLEYDPYLVADLEVVLVRGGEVHRDLSACLRRPPRGDVRLVSLDPGRPQRRRPVGNDRLPLLVDDLSEALHRPLGGLDPLDAGDLLQQRLGNGLRRKARQRLGASPGAHVGVDALGDVREEVVEGLFIVSVRT
jgi:hypothetical protein